MSVKERRIEGYNLGAVAGQAHERERIIKLLSDPVHHNILFPDTHKDCYTCVLVELIKKEK